jgi:hypothetical protein
VLQEIERGVDEVPRELNGYMERISNTTSDSADVRDQLIQVNNLADSQLEERDGILDDFLEKVETPRPDDRDMIFIYNGQQALASGYQTPTATSQGSVAYTKQYTLSPDQVSKALEAIAEEEEVTTTAPRPMRAAKARTIERSVATAAAEEAEKQARQERAAQILKRRAKADDEKREFQKRLAEFKGGKGLVAQTPRVDRTNDLAGISAAIGQIRGNWPTYERTYRGDGKQCWICGLGIFPGGNENQYEHVQPFKTALFESMLYIPGNQLNQDRREYLIARQCIGEYSHNKCNGGGSTARGGRIGKGDIALKMGGKSGHWDDLVPNEDNIREMLIGVNGVWLQMEDWQRRFYGNNPETFYEARRNIIYSRVAQVCFMVRLCVDWNKHAYAKGYALAKVATGGLNVGKDLYTYFKNTSALNPCPLDIAGRYQPMFYMDPIGGVQESVKMQSYTPDFKSTTQSEFNRSYGVTVTGIHVYPDVDANRTHVAERLAWATANARAPVPAAALLAASASAPASASEMATPAGAGSALPQGDSGVRFGINRLWSAVRATAPRARSRSPDHMRSETQKERDPPSRDGGRRPVSSTHRQQKKLRTQKKGRKTRPQVTTEIVPYQP